MTPDQYQRVRTVFHDICDSPPETWRQQLDAACGGNGDVDVRAQVEILLGIDRSDAAEKFLGESIALAAHTSADTEPVPGTIGPYRVVGQIGIGGMGVVYEAEQEQPRRCVAIKLLRAGTVDSRTLRRFRREAELLAQLRHSAIAQIFDAGSDLIFGVRRAYFVMEFIDGPDIVTYANRHRLDERERIALVIRACDGLSHAHHNGVIHRDLKPANILVEDSESRGQPRIVDFGVARQLEPGADTMTVTRRGQLIGTLQSMSPEQASGDLGAVDVRSDVYAMGVILYELLGGRLPYDLDGQLMPEVIRRIREVEPVPLGRHNQACRGDIETIVQKALSKEPDRRYQSARALSADLNNFLTDEPIDARPTSTSYQIRRFTRRNKALVAGATIAAAALLVATTLSVFQARIADAERAQSEVDSYNANISTASFAIDAMDAQSARIALERCAQRLRHFEWTYLWTATDGATKTIPLDGPMLDIVLGDDERVIAVSADGHLHWIGDSGSTSNRDRDPVTNDVPSPTFALARLSPNGQFLVTASAPDRKQIVTWKLDGEDARVVDIRNFDAPVHALDVTSDGRCFAGGQQRISTWFFGDDSMKSWRTISPTLVDASREGPVLLLSSGAEEVIDPETGESLAMRWLPTSTTPAGAISATGDTYFVPDRQRDIRATIVADGKFTHIDGHTGTIEHIAVAPDSAWMASSASDRSLHTWNSSTLKSQGALLGHSSPVTQLAIRGNTVVTVDTSHTLRHWSVTGGAHHWIGREHGSFVYAACFLQDGSTVASAGWDGTVRLWKPEAKASHALYRMPHRSYVRDLGLLPRSGNLLALTSSGTFLLHRNSEVVEKISGGGQALDVHPKHDGYAVHEGNSVRIRSVDGEVKWSASARSNYKRHDIAYSPDGRKVAFTAGIDAVICDADTGVELRRITHPQTVYGLSWRPGTKAELVTANADGIVRLFDTETAELVKSFRRHNDAAYAVAFSADGNRIVSGGRDRQILIWDVTRSDPILRLRGHEDYVYDVSLSPDMQCVLSAGGDRTVQRWGVAPGDRAAPASKRPTTTVDLLPILATATESGAIAKRPAVGIRRFPIQTTDGLAGPIGLPLELRGGTDAVAVDADPFPILDAFTFAAWIRKDDGDATAHQTVVNHEGSWQISIHRGNILATIARRSEWESWITLAPLPTDGSWFHLAFTLGPTAMRTYINGELVFEDNGVHTIGDRHGNLNQLRIGNRMQSESGLVGSVADIQLWSRPLDATEIRSLVHRPNAHVRDGLVEAWQFSETASGETRVVDELGAYPASVLR